MFNYFFFDMFLVMEPSARITSSFVATARNGPAPGAKKGQLKIKPKIEAPGEPVQDLNGLGAHRKMLFSRLTKLSCLWIMPRRMAIPLPV